MVICVLNDRPKGTRKASYKNGDLHTLSLPCPSIIIKAGTRPLSPNFYVIHGRSENAMLMTIVMTNPFWTGQYLLLLFLVVKKD